MAGHETDAAAPESTRRGDPVLALLVVVSAAVLGLPEGSIGVLWPSVSEDLGVPIDRLGLLLYAATAGYLIVAFTHGRTVRRFGTPTVLAGGAAFGIVGAAFFGTATVFAVVVIGYFFIGVAAGGIDTGLNGYVSVHYPRVLSYMHGGFGVGAALSPLAVTALHNAGLSWRYALVGLAAYEAMLLVLFVTLRRRFVRTAGVAPTRDRDLADVDIPFTGESLAPPTDRADGSGASPPVETSERPPARARLLLALSIASFFFYVGVEAGIGAWGYTLMVGREVPTTTAGLSITLFFLSITAGRFAVGAISGRVGPRQVLALAITGAVVGTFVFWTVGAASPGASPFILVFVGLSLAGIFPMLVALTPERLGAERATSVIGWQLAGASIGLSTIPAVMGVIAGQSGTATIGPALFTVAIALAIVHVTALAVERA